jgi:hypothetical protein
MAAAGEGDRGVKPTVSGASQGQDGSRGTPRLRAARDAPQEVWIAFGGAADQAWLRPLRRGFRHCFAALRDEAGWTVVEPVSGRLLVLRINMPAGYDLPGFYRRAGLRVVGPFAPGEARAHWLPPLLPQTCVGLCRALLGAGAPFAITPFGLFRRLSKLLHDDRKNILTHAAA